MVLLLLGTGDAAAQVPRIGGFLRLDRRFEMAGDAILIADSYNRFRPELLVAAGERLTMVASLDVRFYDFARADTAGDLQDETRHFPTSVAPWEAFARISDLPLSGMDVTLGKQRIMWGTADALNPTDQLNAYDFSDITDFTARIPTWAARVEYYVGAFRFEAVWLPTVHAPLLPRGEAGALLSPGDAAAVADSVVVRDHVVLPSRRLGNGTLGARVAGHVRGIDYSLSVLDGFDPLPVPRRVELSRASAAGNGAAIEERWSGFVRRRVVGADFATELAGVGVWGEAALTFPRRSWLTVVSRLRPDSIAVSRTPLDDRPYLQSTVGIDHTFPGGWYANLQWAHGLFFERRPGGLHDYFVGRLERAFASGRMRVAARAALEVARWRDLVDHVGYAGFPELAYMPVDNLELLVGAFLVGGRGASLFRGWSDFDQLYARATVSF